MKLEQISRLVGDVPYMPPDDGRIIYEFVRQSKVEHCLELGFAHGTSSCYIAAALDENGGGYLTTIDNQSALQRYPNIQHLLDKTGLQQYVRPIFAETSYNWELMKILEQSTHNGQCEPQFDFCFIDGAHSWEVDGLAFYLVDKLLKPGGWILFDDLYWTYQEHPDADWAKQIPGEQRRTAQIEKVFSLLVVSHPDFDEFSIKGSWGWARKRVGAVTLDSAASMRILKEIYSHEQIHRLVTRLKWYVKRILGMQR